MKNADMNQVIDLRERLVSFIEQNNLGLRKVASSLGTKGYSTSVLSQYLNGKYQGDVETLEIEIQDYLEREAEEKESGQREIPFVMTKTARTIHSTLRSCQLLRKIGVIHGGSGFGKTTAARNYSTKYKNVILIEANASFTTKVLFRQLARKLNIVESGIVNQMFQDILEKLQGTGRLLIIDEAEHLNIKSLDLIRSINDIAKIGVVLIGLPRFVYQLKNKKGDHEYISSRIKTYVDVSELTEKDTEEIVHEYFPTSNGLWKNFYDACHGNARILSNLLQAANEIITIQKKPLSKSVIDFAKEMSTF